MKILLVDDERDIHQVIGRFLMDFHHEVISAMNGQEALRCLEETPMDLMLSDIRMPNLDGLQLLEIAQVRFPGLPVILMTGHGEESIAMTALQHGACDYLKKPVKLRDLLSRIKALEERESLEAEILSEYQQLLPRDSPQPSPHATAALLELRRLLSTHLGKLEGLQHTLDRFFAGPQADQAAAAHQLQSLHAETPSLLATIHAAVAQIDDLAHAGGKAAGR